MQPLAAIHPTIAREYFFADVNSFSNDFEISRLSEPADFTVPRRDGIPSIHSPRFRDDHYVAQGRSAACYALVIGAPPLGDC